MITASPAMLVVVGAILVCAGSLAVLFLMAGSQPATWDGVLPIIALPLGCYFFVLARRGRREGAQW